MDFKSFIAVSSPFSQMVEHQVLNLLDSSDNLDEEVSLIMQGFVTVPRVSIINFFEEVVPSYSEDEFIMFFRISRDLFEQLAEQYNNSAAYNNIKSQHSVTSAPKSLAVFLWFCANESISYRQLMNLFNITISTVHSMIRRMIAFISCLSPKVITWPTVEEMQHESEYHLRRYGLPGVIGAMDGTHIRIDPPSKNKDHYIDRKGDITLVVQAVCNREYKFLHASIGYPGSVHDARIYRFSDLPEQLEQTPEGYRLLGDSAYPCLIKLMPPYRDNGHLTAAQKHFNYQLSSSRVMIEHAFGVLKQRFRQLYHCKLKGNETLCHFIRACLVLHNLSKWSDLSAMKIDPFPKDNLMPDTQVCDGNDNGSLDNRNEGKLLRDAICASLHCAQGRNNNTSRNK